MVVSTAQPSHVAQPYMAALKDALLTAIVALGLSIPLLALGTEQNISNELILHPRWRYVVIAVGLAFAGRLLYLSTSLLAPTRPKPKRLGSIAPAWRARALSLAGLLLLVLYPLIALALVGKAGAIKWIDNFGIQVLIYIMLGWGLNIVVGLAGLLDLGYVAFYAVGA